MKKNFETYKCTLYFFAPYKPKKIRYINDPFITKRLRKEIMIRSKLHNKFNKSRTSANLQNYKKQRNKCTRVLRNAKQQYFNNLNSKNTTDTKRFWKTVKPLLSNKSKTANTITLNENNRIIKDNNKISHTLNKYFAHLTSTLKLKKTSPALKKNSLEHLLRHFRNHSTKKVKKHFDRKEIFTFCEFKETEIIKTIKEQPKVKDSTFKDIPVKIMVNSVHICSQVLTYILKDCVKSGNFPDFLKYADIIPVFKKGDTTELIIDL